MLNDILRVAALPLNSALGDKDRNLALLNEKLDSLPNKVDILVLPELWTTGYISDAETAEALSEGYDGHTMSHVKKIAQHHSMAVCGSFLARTDDKLYNRAFFVEPSGEASFYDKRHLFVLSEESKIVNKGEKRSPIIRFRGWNISMAICYDLRFPCWLRNKDVKYDLMLIPANWPERRAFAWTHLLQARAIENQAYVVGANRSGSDKYGEYDNLTFVYDYFGRNCAREENGYVVADMLRSKLIDFRKAFPVWLDAD